MSGRLHEGEPDVDAALVRRLVDEQHRQWTRLPLSAVPPLGTDHWLFRLGDDLVVRVPRVEWATGQSDLEARWLPVLATHLPVMVPERVAVGAPAHGYPWAWSVYRWLPGRSPDRTSVQDQRAIAAPLGRFVAALREVDAADGPAPAGELSRGVPLAQRDALTRDAMAAVADEYDVRALEAVWEDSLAAPSYDGPPAWLHGDLLAGNLLVDARDGADTLVAVLDWGPLAVGDPAADAAPAWSVLSAATRAEFRAASGFDDAAWSRGRGWALSAALVALPYYRGSSAALAATSRATIDEVLADLG